MTTETALFLTALTTLTAWAIGLLLYFARCHSQLNEIRKTVWICRDGLRADLAAIADRFDQAQAKPKPARVLGTDRGDDSRPITYCAECGFVASKTDKSCEECGETFAAADGQAEGGFAYGGFGICIDCGCAYKQDDANPACGVCQSVENAASLKHDTTTHTQPDAALSALRGLMPFVMRADGGGGYLKRPPINRQSTPA
jgi:hypothetical protein